MHLVFFSVVFRIVYNTDAIVVGTLDFDVSSVTVKYYVKKKIVLIKVCCIDSALLPVRLR